MRSRGGQARIPGAPITSDELWRARDCGRAFGEHAPIVLSHDRVRGHGLRFRNPREGGALPGPAGEGPLSQPRRVKSLWKRRGPVTVSGVKGEVGEPAISLSVPHPGCPRQNMGIARRLPGVGEPDEGQVR